MEQFVLKEKLKEAIGNRTVQAALFHTFNFDPRFFENYVMPLFIPGKDFRDEIIYNKILWRSCLKEGIIPPIAVFCDFFAKENKEGPSLGYDIYCIKTPACKGSVCNFHPKHIFILVKDEKEEESLLMITGSGNITEGGWCENFESFSIKEIKKNKTFPNKTSTNILQEIISATNSAANRTEFLEAEEKINDFLRYVDFKEPYFNSLIESLPEFIEEKIFIDQSVNKVEIISPYFSADKKLVDYLKSRGITKIHCLIPTLRNNEIQLEKQTFLNFHEAGVRWSFWKLYKQKEKDLNRNGEVRNQHAKIYRFFGAKKIYTIVGSANFTNPAWGKFTKINNKSNIESAFLYIENNQECLLSPVSNFNIDNFTFCDASHRNNVDEPALLNRNPPDIDFLLDWKKNSVRIKTKNATEGCSFYNLFNKEPLVNGTCEKELNPQEIKQLIKSLLIQISQPTEEGIAIHAYYPHQINMEVKPLGFHLDASTILKYWEFLDNDFQKEVLTRNLAESATDESGFLNENTFKKKSQLNEIASNFNGLAKLEKFLFPNSIQNVGDRKQKFKDLKYYLLSENIDTLSFYLEDLRKQLSEGKMMKSTYWMITQIVIVNFYNKIEKWEYRSNIDSAEWSAFKKDIRQKKQILQKNSLCTAGIIPDLHQEWVIKQLAKNYG